MAEREAQLQAQSPFAMKDLTHDGGSMSNALGDHFVVFLRFWW